MGPPISTRWRRCSCAMLARFTQIDYDREMALIAVVVAEAWQGHGLGATSCSA